MSNSLWPHWLQPASSSVHGILQARILEWVAIPVSRGSSQHRDWTWSPTMQADSSPSELPGKPWSWLGNLFLFLLIIQWLHAKLNNLYSDKYRAFIEIHLQIVGILVLESFHTYNYLESVLKYFEQYCQLVGGLKKFFWLDLKKWILTSLHCDQWMLPE